MLLRIRQHVDRSDSGRKLGEYFFSDIFKPLFFQELLQISSKQVGFSHENFYNLQLLFKLCARENVAFYTTVLPNRKCLDFDCLKSRQVG